MNTLPHLLLECIGNTSPEKNIFFTKIKEEYISTSYSQLIRQIYFLIQYFQDLNLEKNDKIAIISENRVEWVATDFACMFSNLITIPVYTSLSESQIKYILLNSNSKVCFVSNQNLLDKILKIKNELPDLNRCVIYNDINFSKYNSGEVVSFQSIIKNSIDVSEVLKHLKDYSKKISPSDVLTIIFTSGTTGIPKGVMLTQENIYSNVIACRKVLTIDENDTFLSYLPYSHAYERTAGYYLAFLSGSTIYYAQNIETIAKQLTEANPTIVITVPRLLDKVYNKLIKSGEEMKDGLKKNIFHWAIKLAQSDQAAGLKRKIADLLVYKKIRQKIGTRLRFFVSGGGALNKAIGKFFDNIGIVILEGYGMTEASPVISVNPPEKNKYGTVGKPLDGVSVKLSDENEILVKGDLVMKGYYKDESATKETIIDSWLHTGDIGEIDSEGYIKITDRKKSLIKSSGGKYIAPTQIEDLIATLSFVENVMIVGNERMYVTALIVPDENELKSYAGKNNLNHNSVTEMLADPALNKLLQREIDKVLKDLSGYERVRKFALLEDKFTIEGGELTPTMKIKRKFVEEKHKDKIEKMYMKI